MLACWDSEAEMVVNEKSGEKDERRAQVRLLSESCRIQHHRSLKSSLRMNAKTATGGPGGKNEDEPSCAKSKLSRRMQVLSVAIRVVSILSLASANFRPVATLLSSSVHNSVIQSSAQLHSGAVQQRCPGGAPVQWRPYLDAASKAHLAPVVAIGSLRHLNLTPIPLLGNLGEPLASSSIQQHPIAFHAQNVNNVGVNIEATFTIVNVLKRTNPTSLNASQTIKLFYKVSASLSTTSALMTLANSNAAEQNLTQPARGLAPGAGSGQAQHQASFRQLMRRQRAPCALELSEQELEQKAGKIFKLNKNYILFLDQAGLGAHKAGSRAQQASSRAAGASTEPSTSSVYPFASHELLTNQTSRVLRRILCKNCGKLPTEPRAASVRTWPPIVARPAFRGREGFKPGMGARRSEGGGFT